MGLMDMFSGKTFLADSGKYLANVPGKLLGPAKMSSEGDFNIAFVPDDKKWLANRNGKSNQNGLLELKVKITPTQSKAFIDSIQPLLGQTVYASGVLVDDDSQGGKAQVQPLDMIWAPLPQANYPDWFKNILGSLEDPQGALAYRIVSASDASKSPKPPRAEQTRQCHVQIPYPPKPDKSAMKIDFEIKKIVLVNADFDLSNDLVHQRIVLEVTVKSAKEEGPGVFIGDLAVLWRHDR
jgi:hypothetical protein